MKLLFDPNLSFRLAGKPADQFPEFRPGEAASVLTGALAAMDVFP